MTPLLLRQNAARRNHATVLAHVSREPMQRASAKTYGGTIRVGSPKKSKKLAATGAKTPAASRSARRSATAYAETTLVVARAHAQWAQRV